MKLIWLMAFLLTSSAFQEGQEIPSKFTCQGENISPELSWSNPPEGTQSFVLIIDDPDAPDPNAPKMTYVHWILYNIPASVSSLKEDEAQNGIPKGTLEGINDGAHTGYRGPCPPIGRHRYFHKLYALDTIFDDLNQPNKPTLLKAMEGHVLGQATLIGTYQKH